MSFRGRISIEAPLLPNWPWKRPSRTRIPAKPAPQSSLIFQLPDEIFIDIFSNLPTFRLEQAYWRVDQHDRQVSDARYFSNIHATRHRVLLTFTRLCHSTRQKFLPWLWEHAQSLCVRSPGMGNLECHLLADKVFRRLSWTLIANPSLTVHVKTLSVHISRSNVSNLVKLLLPLLPNLHTLEVLTNGYNTPGFEGVFKSVKLPQIRTLVIDAQAHHFMKCCTHVRKLIIHQRGFDVSYLKSVPFVANSLVCIALCSPVPEIVQELSRLCPNVEEFGIVQPYGFQVSSCIDAAQGFSKLRLLEVVLPCRPDAYCSDPRPVWEMRIKKRAVHVLGKMRGHTKTLKIISIGILPVRWEDTRDIETQTVVVP